uniref:Uncharacterized protein n=1 Tax=Arundo donax TaxID=35708 RepID=A0A0A9DN74_ARUDO
MIKFLRWFSTVLKTFTYNRTIPITPELWQGPPLQYKKYMIGQE